MKIIFLFPGYGTQFVGMCKEMYDSSRLVQEFFEEASNCLSTNFVKQCFASSDADLATMVYAYPALFLVSAAICALLQSEGIQPHAVAGYGVGEYSALFAARSLNLPDGLYLLYKLFTLYESHLDLNALKVIRVHGLSSRELTTLLAETAGADVSISHYMSKDEHQVAGMSEAMVDVEQRIKATKAKIKHLSFAHGLHSHLAFEVFEAFKPHMAKVDVKDPLVPLLSCLDGRSLIKAASLRDRISKSIITPVKWSHVVKKLGNYDVIIEIGPPSPYLDQLRSEFTQCTILSVLKPEDIERVKSVCKDITDRAQEPPHSNDAPS